jgi:hypothetical protein
MAREYVQTGPTSWGFVTVREPPKRGDLPVPYVISDTMDPVEQVDGNFYTSKRQFRAVGRSLGLTEVGNEKPKMKVRATADKKAMREARIRSLKKAQARYNAGERPAPLAR